MKEGATSVSGEVSYVVCIGSGSCVYLNVLLGVLQLWWWVLL